MFEAEGIWEICAFLSTLLLIKNCSEIIVLSKNPLAY